MLDKDTETLIDSSSVKPRMLNNILHSEAVVLQDGSNGCCTNRTKVVIHKGDDEVVNSRTHIMFYVIRAWLIRIKYLL